MATPERTMVFVSHATPEDNEFARWLTLQLANEGYPVWCDVTKLLGGEKFWEDIQDAITSRTIKFLFVLSRSSNQKSGALDELQCALGVEKKINSNFIITLKIDDLPYEDVQINLQRRNHISFQPSWANGLAQLLKCLQRDLVPTHPCFNPEAVCTWWRSQTEFDPEQGLIHAPEEQLSNWFRIDDMPLTLNRHVVARKGTGKIQFDATNLGWPAVNDTDISFLSFAPAADFAQQFPPQLFIAETHDLSVQSIIERQAPKGFSGRLIHLLRTSWERMMAATDLRCYELSNRAKCYYFVDGTLPNNRLHFTGVKEKRAYRDVIGYSTRGGNIRYWHYGISAKPALHPANHFVIKGHVIFSNDSNTIWASKDKLAKARRTQCKNWWNDEWRDRLLAVMEHLTNEKGIIELPIGTQLSLKLKHKPEVFKSPVSYIDPLDIVKEEAHGDYDFEGDDVTVDVLAEEEGD